MARLLTSENINAAVDETEEFLTAEKIERKEILRVRLGVEEALLNFRERFGEEAEFELRTGKILGKIKISISVPGAMYDPLIVSSEDESGLIMRSMLTTLGKLPVWNYVRRTNTLTYTVVKKRIPEWTRLLVAVVAAVILALIVRTLPANVSSFIQAQLFQPLLDTFLGFLNAIAGPMIFLAVVWGIYSMGDADTFSVLGKRLSIRFLVSLTAFSVIIFACAVPFFNLVRGEAEMGDGFSSLYQMVLDIVPSNLFTPFTTGNTLQILFVAIVIGVALILIGEKTQSVALLSEQLNYIVQGIMSFIARLVPFFIFGSLFNIIVASDFGSLAVGGKFFVGAMLMNLGFALLHTLYLWIFRHISPLKIWKNSRETVLIGLSTASSSAAFSSNLSSCINKHGIDEKLASFGVPFTQVLYMPGTCGVFMCAALSVAENRGVEVSPSWFVSCLIISMIVSAACPPIPGGSTASFSVVFLQLGLPMDSLAIILGLNVLLDFMHTATNLFGDQCLLVDCAASFDMLEEKD